MKQQILITTHDGCRAILNPDYISEIIEVSPGRISIEVVNPIYGANSTTNTSYVVNETLEAFSVRLRDACLNLPTADNLPPAKVRKA
jgi:2-C-methyl-D-erythritol 4-phosphate cytidylyltransferase